MYSLHDVEITGIVLDRILTCEIENHIGEHSTLMLSGMADDVEKLLYEVPDCQNIEVILRGGKDPEILFSGILTSIRVTESGQMKTVWIEGKSRSWLMDRTRHSRSFQDSRMSFQALAQKILEDYGDSSLIYAAESRETESLIIQYEETDWAFLKRVFSLAGLVLTPESRRPGLKLYAGVPKLPERKLQYEVLSVEKDMESYYRLKANNRQVHTADFTQYTVVSGQLMGIFETVLIQGQPLAAYACRYSFDDQEMTAVYCLQSPKGLTVQAVYPMHLIGAALMAKVVNVSASMVQAAMEIDGTHVERAVHWFPFSTLSASPDGSGWYCMPEIGDDVRIYFPSKQEEEAVALSAVSSYETPQEGSDRMQDPNSRYLRTRYGQELAMNPEYIRLSCGGGKSAVTIQTDGTLSIQGQETAGIQAAETIIIHADQELSIHVREKFLMHSYKNGAILSEGGKIALMGTEVKLD